MTTVISTQTYEFNFGKIDDQCKFEDTCLVKAGVETQVPDWVLETNLFRLASQPCIDGDKNFVPAQIKVITAVNVDRERELQVQLEEQRRLIEELQAKLEPIEIDTIPAELVEIVEEKKKKK